MLRRFFLKLGLLLPTISFLPRVAAAKTPKPGLTIAQIVAVAWPAAIYELKRGHDWVDPDLRKAAIEKRLEVKPYLGTGIQLWADPPSRVYPVEEVHIPVVWQEKDEIQNERESHKIDFVTRLIENAVAAHDDILLSKLGEGRAFAAKDFTYQRGEIQYFPEQKAYAFNIYSAVAFIPKETI